MKKDTVHIFKFNIIILTTVLFFVKETVAQENYRLQAKVCESLVQKNKINSAIDCYQKVQTPSEVATIALRLCDLYARLEDSINLSLQTKKAIERDKLLAFLPLMKLSANLHEQKKDKLSFAILNVLEINSTDSLLKQKVIEKKLKYNLIPLANQDPIEGIKLKNLGPKINTLENEYLPSLSLDGETLIFTRNTGGNEDFFISVKDSLGNWIQSQNIGYPPNTNLPDGGAKLSGDGHYLFYTRCDLRSPNGIVGGGCDIAFSYKENGVWSSPQYFGFTINTTGYEGQPCLSIDNQDMYFVSNRPGGYGGKDIWVSHFSNRFWSEPENLGPSINTAKDETSPFIHADNETLYFSSNGHPSIGKSDLYVSRKNENKTWRKPINLGFPINTTEDDGSIVVSANGKYGLCASTRTDGLGGVDIYEFNLYPAIQPQATLCYKGKTIDKFTNGLKKKVNISFYNYPELKLLNEQISNSGNASFCQALKKGESYLIQVSIDSYRTFNRLINIKNDSLGDIIEKDIALKTPHLVDTLFSTSLMFQPNELKLEQGSIRKLDSVLRKWKYWSDDSARIHVELHGSYYCCDSLQDTLYLQRLKACDLKLNHISNIFHKRKIACDWVMLNSEMVIYNDDEELFDEIKLYVIENY